ncbi:hypothetical protein RQN30_10130 [Arcanobacterium hippocoleae]
MLVLNGSIAETELQLAPGRGIDYQLVWDSNWETPRENLPLFKAGAPTRIGGTSIQIYFANRN